MKLALQLIQKEKTSKLDIGNCDQTEILYEKNSPITCKRQRQNREINEKAKDIINQFILSQIKHFAKYKNY